MEITRKVILDLMPLYLAGEVSKDTRALIEKFLETDPEFAEMAKKTETAELPGDTPVPLNREDQMNAYIEAKRLMFKRTIYLAIIISVSVMSFLALAGVMGLMFLR